jgi:hypothetical protein
MSSGTKHCALGVHCFIFKFRIRIRDRSRVDWTEIQDSDEKTKVTTLLLKAEGGAGDTLLAGDVRMELDYLTALDGGRYRLVVMLVPVRNVLSYILSYMSPFFSGACHFLWGHIPSLHTRLHTRRVALLGDSRLVVHRRCGASLLARVKACADGAGGADGADGADGCPHFVLRGPPSGGSFSMPLAGVSPVPSRVALRPVPRCKAAK